MAEKYQFEIDVPTTITNSSDRTITMVSDYHLTRVKIRKTLYYLEGTIMVVLGVML